MSIELTVANEVEKSGYQCVSIARYPSEHTCVRAAGMRRLADFLQWSLVRLRYQLFKPGKLYPGGLLRPQADHRGQLADL
jgi:hypothetical protein